MLAASSAKKNSHTQFFRHFLLIQPIESSFKMYIQCRTLRRIFLDFGWGYFFLHCPHTQNAKLDGLPRLLTFRVRSEAQSVQDH